MERQVDTVTPTSVQGLSRPDFERTDSFIEFYGCVRCQTYVVYVEPEIPDSQDYSSRGILSEIGAPLLESEIPVETAAAVVDSLAHCYLIFETYFDRRACNLDEPLRSKTLDFISEEISFRQ